MKKLKFILTILILSQCFTGFAQISQNTQDPNNTPYVGTWEYVDGNKIFRLFLKEDTEPIEFNRYAVLGHYEMVEVNPVTGEEQTIYTSSHPSLPDRLTPILGTFYNDINDLTGSFQEFHANNLSGGFLIKIEPTCSTCPKKIKWELTPTRDGIRVVLPGEPPYSREFEVPTDIILEKVN